MARIRQIIWNYSLGLGGGSSRAATASLKPVRAWEPSQKGLLADWPQRQREITVRPASPKAAPVGSRISKSPSIRMGPLLKTETLVVIIDGSTGVGGGGQPPGADSRAAREGRKSELRSDAQGGALCHKPAT